MTDLVRINNASSVGLPVTLADGSRYTIPAFVLVNVAGIPSPISGSGGGADLDTDGNIVPTWKKHTYTYDDSGNLSTDTVTDGVGTWVRTYTYTPSGPASDSGWVKQ